MISSQCSTQLRIFLVYRFVDMPIAPPPWVKVGGRPVLEDVSCLICGLELETADAGAKSADRQS